MWNKEINEFVRKLNINAPLSSSGKGCDEYKSYKYPYKPILLISIISNINSIDLLFNNKIIIDYESPITHTYYELLTNSNVFFSFLKTHNSKEDWFEIFNDSVKKQTVSNIFENPAYHLQIKGNNFWEINKKERWVKINIDKSIDLLKLKDFLLEQAKICLWKCLPDYKGLSINELIDYQSYMINKIMIGIDQSDKTTRKYQHIFSKIIFERDRKCRICCLDMPQLLEAAHIKPYSKCDNDLDRYSKNNGILLCCNHHKLYDRGYFTFTNDWKIKISKELKEKDSDLLIKTFEPCFTKNINDLSIDMSKEYVEYHHKNIFRN